ncbi:hypothetical protein FE697_000980 [Mumia zhuanghuii]|uniref:Uncharacterized protein n=2 Tax=Mumia TaxID=1546255 RepID=A0ABW1QGS6_9ACTN|nr:MULTISPECIES: hypothetical protein [Mumia]KAA1424536.1 hypothetical protein FE697_000980 [Mumia zhuanghuii]
MRITREETDAVEESDLSSLAKAEKLIEFATSGEYDLADDVAPRSLLVAASEFLGFDGAWDRQEEVLAMADTADGVSAIHPDVVRVGTALARGLDPTPYADRYRKSGRITPASAHYMADLYDEAGEPLASERWLNIGIRALEHLDPDMVDTTTWDLLLLSRRDLRTRLGRPKDGYDEEADAADMHLSDVHRPADGDGGDDQAP